MTLEDLLTRLRAALPRRPEVRFAVLFGSAVDRGPDEARDIDLAISFRGSPSLMERGALAVHLEHALGREVDIVDVEEASTLLRWEVTSRGRLVTAPDRDAWVEFQARVPIEYADLRPYFDRETEGLRRSLSGARWSG